MPQSILNTQRGTSALARAAVRSGCLLLLLPTLALVGCDNDPAMDTASPPPGVLVAKVARRELSETLEYVGQTVAVNDVSLRAQVEGYLQARTFAEGQDVEAGAELFLIDAAGFEAGVAAANGKVAQMKAAASRAAKDVKRYAELIKKQSVSQQTLDDAQSELEQASANLKTAEAQLQKAQVDLSFTVIKAPFSGRIGRAAASVGDLVSPQSGELARLVELDPIYANFNVAEGDVIAAKRRIQQSGTTPDLSGIEVRLRLPDGSTFEQVGRVDFIDNVVDRRTGTIVMRARFPNPQQLLVPGLYVSTSLGRNETSDKLVIPQSAVQEDQAGPFVMVVAPDGRVELRRIRSGQAYSGDLVVDSGLEPYELVIVEGIQKVRPGMLVDAKIALTPTMERGNSNDGIENSAQDPPLGAGDAARER